MRSRSKIVCVSPWHTEKSTTLSGRANAHTSASGVAKAKMQRKRI